MSEAGPSRYPASSVSGTIKSSHGDIAKLTYDVLDEREAIKYVSDDGAGATVLFSGTTRDSFQGKRVTKLEYEAYTSLALKTMQSLLEQVRTSVELPVISPNAAASKVGAEPATRITRCYIAHRLGEVDVGQCSILIAVSSPHRKEAFVVAEWLLEEVKRSVTIWKREFYASGESIQALDGQSGQPSSAPKTQAQDDPSQWSWKANFPSQP